MGWERKRGKLHELNRLLRGADDTTFVSVEGRAPSPTGIRYVITLDADTRLPVGSARALVGTLAHPSNRALFDPAHGFAGCIPGIHEVLRRQGLLAGRWCLDPHEQLSPGQAAEIDRVSAAYPELNDDSFVAEHLDEWLRP